MLRPLGKTQAQPGVGLKNAAWAGRVERSRLAKLQWVEQAVMYEFMEEWEPAMVMLKPSAERRSLPVRWRGVARERWNEPRVDGEVAEEWDEGGRGGWLAK